MSILTTTHLNFTGQARAALDFYHSVLGGRLTIATYAEMGMPAGLPDSDNVVWGQVESDLGFRVMAYDVPSQAGAEFTPTWTRRENGVTLTSAPYFLSLRGDSVEEVQPLWEGLSAGSRIVTDFGPAPWAPAFGMMIDPFGVTWMIDVAAAW